MHGNFQLAGQKERGARQLHKRLLYCVNVNRTSLDHLLLGKYADVDKSVESPDCSAASARFPYNPFLQLSLMPCLGTHCPTDSNTSVVSLSRTMFPLFELIVAVGGVMLTSGWSSTPSYP